MSSLPNLLAPNSLIDTELMEALSDELRVRIFAYLCLNAAGASEIAAALGVSWHAVRYRLEHLRKGGWIADDPSVPGRGDHYRATRAMVIPPGAWDRLPDLARHKIAVRMLSDLYADAGASIAAGRFLRPGIYMSLTPMVVDARGRKDVNRVLERTLTELVGIQAECDQRLQSARSVECPETSLTIGLTGFESLRDPAEDARASATMRL